jgi:hypothetical protein
LFEIDRVERNLLSLLPNFFRTVLAVQAPLRRAKPARPGRLRAVLKNDSIKRESQEVQISGMAALPMVGDAPASHRWHNLSLVGVATQHQG